MCMLRLSVMSSSFITVWTVAHQAPLSMGFFRQEYWSRLPFSAQGDPPHPGIEPESAVSPALAGRFSTTEPPGKPRGDRKIGNSWRRLYRSSLLVPHSIDGLSSSTGCQATPSCTVQRWAGTLWGSMCLLQGLRKHLCILSPMTWAWPLEQRSHFQ